MTDPNSDDDDIVFMTPNQVAPESAATSSDQRVRIVSGRYRLPDPLPNVPDDRILYKRVKKDGSTSWMRATRLAGGISDQYSLSQWSQRMVAKGLSQRAGLVALAATLDPDRDREELNVLCARARDAASALEGADLGTAVHAFTESWDRYVAMAEPKPPIPERFEADVCAWSACLLRYGLYVLPEYIERVVVNYTVGAAGRWDRIVEVTQALTLRLDGEQVHIPPGVRLVLDFKTGRNLEYSWDDIAIQQSIYNHADLVWDWRDGYEAMPTRLYEGVALVVHLPVGTGNATLYAVDTEYGWEGANISSQVLRWRGSGRGVVPQTPVDRRRTERAARVSALLTAVRAAPTVEDLASLYTSGTSAGIWDAEIRAAAAERHRQLRPLRRLSD